VARSKFEMAKHLEAKHFSENVEAENKIWNAQSQNRSSNNNNNNNNE
jgi:hypothetical protein